MQLSWFGEYDQEFDMEWRYGAWGEILSFNLILKYLIHMVVRSNTTLFCQLSTCRHMGYVEKFDLCEGAVPLLSLKNG